MAVQDVLAIALIFGVPIVAILTAHHRKVLELKLRLRQSADEQVVERLRRIEAEVRELRDTSTQFDVSFDTALQRLESRVDHIERRAGVIASDSVGVNRSLD